MSVDLGAIREAGRTVGLIDQRILSIANRLFNRRLEGLSFGRTRIVNVPFKFGSKGIVLVTNDPLYFRLSLGGAATILGWSMAATVAGVASNRTATVDVLTGATLATVASICGVAANRPHLIAQSELSDQVPSGWTANVIPDPYWLMANPTAVDGAVETVSLTLLVAVGS